MSNLKIRKIYTQPIQIKHLLWRFLHDYEVIDRCFEISNPEIRNQILLIFA